MDYLNGLSFGKIISVFPSKMVLPYSVDVPHIFMHPSKVLAAESTFIENHINRAFPLLGMPRTVNGVL
jgi:hypothetical protein